MKKIILSIITLLCICVKAQTISLSTYVEDIKSGMYFKDIENTLPLFTGKWAANYEGNMIVLNISDRIEKYPINLLDTNYDRDILFMRYTVNDSSGNQLATTMNKTITDANIISTFSSPDKTKVGFNYKGEECGIGNGSIILTKIDDNHLKWQYRSMGGIIDPNRCPEYSPNIKSYIPKILDLVFTRQ
ncbi:hypothetical protein [Elizabethkingia meningoseptica]|uniref:hypothetical protein n=1 Tax=Elizabethkingia meningoseptica TaxID=238 RepID=UPI0023B133FC|nr:hypothetical protein [Elizabethkingia meningoseptica]MDE5490651.1 hypothetical protein [Elizabethkingia meningoseptica]